MGGLETVKNRVRKLLALSKSNNENEAAAAIEKANYLMAKYKLDDSTVKFENVKVRSTKRYVRWRAIISNAVSYLYCCYCYKDDSGHYIFTGEPLYVFMASEMYSYLVKTVERIAKKSIRKNAKYLYRQSFKVGMADRIYDRIFTLGKNCSWAPQRRSMEQEVENYVESTVSLRSSKTPKRLVNRTAFNRGVLIADSVSLARQAGYSGNAARRIAGPPAQGELF
jgi:hypothetical protein